MITFKPIDVRTGCGYIVDEQGNQQMFEGTFLFLLLHVPGHD